MLHGQKISIRFFYSSLSLFFISSCFSSELPAQICVSDDGNTLVAYQGKLKIWKNGTKICESPVTGYSSIQLSGSGDRLFLLSQGHLHCYRVPEDLVAMTPFKILNDSVTVQSGFGLVSDLTGNWVATTVIHMDTARNYACQPSYRFPVRFNVTQNRLDTLEPPEKCRFARQLEVLQDGSAIVEYYGHIVYISPDRSIQAVKEFAGMRLVWDHRSWTADGNTLLLNGLAPLTKAQKKQRALNTQEYLDERYSYYKNTRESKKQRKEREKEMADEKKKIESFYKDSALTLLISRREVDGWSKPAAILPPDLDPVGAWGASISPDGQHVVWLDFERGKDGNSIIASRVIMTHLINGSWSTPEIICDAHESAMKFALSNKNLVFENNGKIMLYDFSATKGILTELK